MLTTRNYMNPIARPKQKCPKCKHIGNAADFDLNLPGVSECFSKSGKHFTVHFDGEDEPRKFAHAPSLEYIAAEVAKLEREAAKPKRSHKKKDTVLNADPI